MSSHKLQVTDSQEMAARTRPAAPRAGLHVQHAVAALDSGGEQRSGSGFDEAGNVVMVAGRDQNQITAANDEKDAELQAGPAFKVMPDGADADAGVLVGPAKAFFQAVNSGMHSRPSLRV